MASLKEERSTRAKAQHLATRKRRWPKLLDSKWLRTTYLKEGKSLKDIAQEVGCTRIVVTGELKRLGVNIREGGSQTDWTRKKHRAGIIMAGKGAYIMAECWGKRPCTRR